VGKQYGHCGTKSSVEVTSEFDLHFAPNSTGNIKIMAIMHLQRNGRAVYSL
jgi:hypothetical protein